MQIAWLAALITLLGTQAQARPTLLELFTSQSCSSCPPADALLGALKESSADVLPLSMHVTYWNGAGWNDPYSLPQATARQRAYAASLRSEVFTPELVIDGHAFAVGSDRAAVLAAITAARRLQASGPSLALHAAPGGMTAAIGAGAGEADLLLIGYDPAHTTHIAGGENGGVELHETNVVRSLRVIAHWTGAALHLAFAPPAGQVAALILQRADGTILAAAVSIGT